MSTTDWVKKLLIYNFEYKSFAKAIVRYEDMPDEIFALIDENSLSKTAKIFRVMGNIITRWHKIKFLVESC